MKGNLAQSEPKVLESWEEKQLYSQIIEHRKNAPTFILHDGPPYANGDIHIGHALNKILKDFIVRYKGMRGNKAPYIPGWDCHGLPIEYALMKELKVTKHQVDIIDFRRKARAYAQRYVGIQREQFKRLGVLGDWDHPYLTLEPGYVSAALRVLSTLAGKGFITRARKPVNWCWSCETALAEAEVEYEDREDQSIYVKFRVKKWPKACKYEVRNDENVVVWTTTPWTLPANKALCFHPDEEYSLVEVNGNSGNECLIIASKRVDIVLEKLRFKKKDERRRFLGKELCADQLEETLQCSQPATLNLNDISYGVTDLSVSMEEGTGIVHIAPGHGEEDYLISKRYGFEVFSPVNEKGQFVPGKVLPQLNGKLVFDANTLIIEELRIRDNRRLLYVEPVRHSYPHCWRCHEPIIFRATDQWFLNVEHEDLRKKLLQVIEDQVRWIPPEGRERIAGMVKTRPDWCLSRQRLWGIPIPALICSACGEGILDPRVIDRFSQAIENDPEGSDRWFSEPVSRWLPEGFRCHCGGTGFKPGTDILDVWFDSGVSHQGVLKRREDHSVPADMYLEGSDQHRGWFQVSLITGVALEGKAPYRSVLTHGFVVDGEGRKMSKSMGNVVAPQEVVSSMGADVLRLWVASSDYREDVRISPEILSQVAEVYRKIRNTLRFCLANLSDFTPADSVPLEKMEEMDRWILSRLSQLVEEVTDAYDAFTFHRVVKAIHEFCTVLLSNFYLDVIKDRLYTSYPKDPMRRSIQTALAQMSDTLIRLITPVLPFTAEEAWAALTHPQSVHLQIWPDPQAFRRDSRLEADWSRLLEFRDQAMKVLEKAREAGEIGDSLEAELEILAQDKNLLSFLKERQPALELACIVSRLQITQGSGSGPELEMKVRPSPGSKCQRCWMRLPSVGTFPEHPALCHRCVEVLGKLAVSGK